MSQHKWEVFPRKDGTYYISNNKHTYSVGKDLNKIEIFLGILNASHNPNTEQVKPNVIEICFGNHEKGEVCNYEIWDFNTPLSIGIDSADGKDQTVEVVIRDNKILRDENGAPLSMTDAMTELYGSSAYSNDRNRPYDGQRHTNNGERGNTEVKGLTMRDIRDCLIKACLRLDPETNKYVEENRWLMNDIYKVNFSNIDPLAMAQNLTCEIEKMMGIYPNVPKLKGDNDGNGC